MAEILLGPDANPADIRRIAHDADGNPLFVEELVAALVRPAFRRPFVTSCWRASLAR